MKKKKNLDEWLKVTYFFSERWFLIISMSEKIDIGWSNLTFRPEHFLNKESLKMPNSEAINQRPDKKKCAKLKWAKIAVLIQ